MNLRFLLPFAAALVLVGCLGNSGSSAPPPADIKPVAGDGIAGITWSPQLGVTYIAFGATNPALTSLNWTDTGIGGFALLNGGTSSVPPALLCNSFAAISPNGLAYYFTVDAHTGTSPGGSGSPTITVTPRPSGGAGTWSVGTPVGSHINGVGYAAFTTCQPSGLPTGVYAAVGAGGAIFSSSDGKTWTPRSPANFTTDLYAAASFTANINLAPTILLVAVGANGAVIRSNDGVNWTPTITGSPAIPALRAVSSAGSNFVAVGDNGYIQTSADGVNWVIRPSNTTANLHGVDCVSSTCIAVGDAGVADISLDTGTTWFVNVLGNGTSTLRSVTYGNFDNNVTGSNVIGVGGTTTINTWVVVGDNGAAFQTNNFTSDAAAIIWTPTPIASAADLLAISYTTQFVAIDSAGNAFASQTAIEGTWSAPVATGIPDPVSVATNQHGYVLVGSAGDNASSF
ncbi:MAG TPA: hypothetical protein VH278_14005 [Burkholderiaceae bacterium]|nr:hypothetical protein [Burkholderiaceae bacterium]